MKILAKYTESRIIRIEPVEGAKVYAGENSIVNEETEVISHLINQGFTQQQIDEKMPQELIEENTEE